MIDVGVRVCEHPAALVRICRKILQHIFVNFFLKIDSEGAIGTDDFVGADASARGNVAIGIGDADVGGIVANREMSALDGDVGEFFEKGTVRALAVLRRRKGRSETWERQQECEQDEAGGQTAHVQVIRRRAKKIGRARSG